MRAWYLRQYDRTKVGTLLATAHFAVVAALLAGISIAPSNDWMWWPVVPFFLDLPVSLLIQLLCSGLMQLIEWLPHAGLERLMLQLRDPFQSIDLFWLPGFAYLALGTVWHFYWPLVLQRLMSARSPDGV
jgi:hypothetical protein